MPCILFCRLLWALVYMYAACCVLVTNILNALAFTLNIHFCLTGPQSWTKNKPWPHSSARTGPPLNRCGDLSLWRSRLLRVHCFEHHDGWWGIVFSRRTREGHVLSALLECLKQISLDLCRYGIPPQLCRQWIILHPWQFSPQPGES